MPHVILRSPLSAAEIVDRFAPKKLSLAGAHIAMLHAWLGRERDVALFEVVVEEPSISQHTMIRLAARAGAGEYIVKQTTIGHARSTLGMHRAVAAVGRLGGGAGWGWDCVGAAGAGLISAQRYGSSSKIVVKNYSPQRKLGTQRAQRN